MSAVFEAGQPFEFFDYFRVPYRLTERGPEWPRGIPERHPLRSFGRLAWPDPARSLWWPCLDAAAVEPSPLGALAVAGSWRVGDVPVHGGLLPDERVEAWLRETPGAWSRATEIRDERGNQAGSVWRCDDGSVLLPFDPAEVMRGYWSERYQDLGASGLAAPARRLALGAYYRARPLIPRPAQIWLRRRLSRVQARSRFPRWPVEPALHNFYGWLFGQAASVAGEPLPWLAPWPHGHSWAFVLTHDVETSTGYDNLGALRELEVELGYRSSWNFVPGRYQVDDALVRELVGDGFEVGVHGLYHDGRDLESLEMLSERLPAIRRAAERWQAAGFRSPATHRVWAWMPMLGFDYDSSYPDSDPFEPQSGGCCSWLPFFNQDMVELPITMSQDHTVFVILRDAAGGDVWERKADFLRDQGGMALLITHPDYLDDRLEDAYARLLRRYQRDDSAWRALPQDVSAWWRRRAASCVEPTRSGWRVAGPAAAEARIAYAVPVP